MPHSYCKIRKMEICMSKGFIAYSSEPSLIGETIEKINNHVGCDFETWSAMDIWGNAIGSKVQESIINKDLFVADISILNPNVVYEIGFAIGKQKKILLIRNKSIQIGLEEIKEIGIFDTIGYKEYENSQDLAKILTSYNGKNNISYATFDINQTAPLYLLDAKYKNDKIIRISSRIKKAAVFYRSFDPNEYFRMNLADTIKNVATSISVVVSLLPKVIEDAKWHNLRAAFIAGLAHGMEKDTIILALDDAEIPLDYRDKITVCKDDNQIDDAITLVAKNIFKALQRKPKLLQQNEKLTILETIDLGASAAENEFRDLSNYYLKTDQFNRVARGEARIVCGRKGSGKTALFSQLRNTKRIDKKNIIIDLKPESYTLIKFKEDVLSLLQEGTLEHTLHAFWEYILLLELCYKVLEKDKIPHMQDSRLTEKYQQLESYYNASDYISDGDFSERLSSLINSIQIKFQDLYEKQNHIRLSSAQITELLYKHEINELKQHLKDYLRLKKEVWLLIDNVDKGWATDGIKKEDLIIIRTLLEATRKIERQLSDKDIFCKTVVFLRNDVYELLLNVIPDRGKESKVVLDWTDKAALKELIRRRLIYSSSFDKENDFKTIWESIAESHVKGEYSSDYIINRTLMRPRALIDCLKECIGTAINRGHEKVLEQDFLDGMERFSIDMAREISLEIRDVFKDIDDAIFIFVGQNELYTEDDLKTIYLEAGIPVELHDKLTEYLLWFGVLGITDGDQECFIYDVYYDLKMLLKKAKVWSKEQFLYKLYPAYIFKV